MEISSNQALEALDDVAQAQRRLSVLRGYRYAAPYFFLWGAIWLVGYVVSYLAPSRAGQAWIGLDGLGFAASLLLAWRQAREVAGPARQARAHSRRLFALFATCVGFLLATYAVLQPHDAAQFAVYPGLLIAAIYIGVGIWRGLRWSIAGLVLAALALAAYFLLRPYVLLWMAGAGGGTLLLTGAWLRRS